MMMYVKNPDFLIIDNAGFISAEKGLSNLNAIETQLRAMLNNTRHVRILLDVRHTEWADRATHDLLSKTARMMFGDLAYRISLAVWNNTLVSSQYDGEQWFIEKQDALNWLDNIQKL